MIESLMGLPGRVSALLSRLTETRAGNLDRLDAAVSSRAPSSTALSNLVWTDAIAAKLASMHVKVPPKTLPAPWGLPSDTTVAAGSLSVTGANQIVYSRAGAGYIKLLAFVWLSSIEITIDGVVVYSGNPGSPNLYGIWGQMQGTLFASGDDLPFNSSLVIKVTRYSGGANVTPGAVYISVVGT